MRRLIAVIPGPSPDLTALPPAVSSSVGFLATQLGARVRMHFEAALRENALQPRDYMVMMILREEGGMSQQALGARAGMDRTTTMMAAQSLEQAGLLARADDPADRRVYRLSLTPAGRQMVGSLERRVRAAEQEVLAPLDKEDRASLVQLLRTALGLDPRVKPQG